MIVHAYKITDTQFFYKCSFCPKNHVHGNCRDFLCNRTENRSSHCDAKGATNNMDIVIDDNTIRDLKIAHNQIKWLKYLQTRCAVCSKNNGCLECQAAVVDIHSKLTEKSK